MTSSTTDGVEGIVAAFVSECCNDHPASVANVIRAAEKLQQAPYVEADGEIGLVAGTADED